jgi:hypothetical protein
MEVTAQFYIHISTNTIHHGRHPHCVEKTTSSKNHLAILVDSTMRFNPRRKLGHWLQAVLVSSINQQRDRFVECSHLLAATGASIASCWLWKDTSGSQSTEKPVKVIKAYFSSSRLAALCRLFVVKSPDVGFQMPFGAGRHEELLGHEFGEILVVENNIVRNGSTLLDDDGVAFGVSLESTGAGLLAVATSFTNIAYRLLD